MHEDTAPEKRRHAGADRTAQRSSAAQTFSGTARDSAGRHSAVRGAAEQDLGPEVDWRLSRVSSQDADLPERLRGRLVLASDQPGRRSVQMVPAVDKRVQRTVSLGPAKATPASSLVVSVRVGQGVAERSVQVRPPPSAAAPPEARAVASQSSAHGGFFYRDPAGNALGPVPPSKLLGWLRGGFMPASTLVSRDKKAWAPLSEALAAQKPKAAQEPPRQEPQKAKEPPRMPRRTSEASAPAGAAGVEGRVSATRIRHPGDEAPAISSEPSPPLESQTVAPPTPAAPAGPPLDLAAALETGWPPSYLAAAQRLFADSESWIYMDPQNVEQGPWSSASMLEWFIAGFLHDSELPLQRAGGTVFRPLKEWLDE